jgi:hypothetical protein
MLCGSFVVIHGSLVTRRHMLGYSMPEAVEVVSAVARADHPSVEAVAS